jgi:hypothetical protein
MKKFSLVFGIALLALIVIVIYINRREDGTSTVPSHASNSVARQHTSQKRLETETNSPRAIRSRAAAVVDVTDAREDDIESLRRELKTAKAELENLSRPLAQDILSSTVNAEISPGETLVTGGYKTADGNYEFTFLTPRSVTLSDGSERIEIKSRVLSVGPEVVQENGLDSLATNARHTLQHAEAWKQDDTDVTLSSMTKAEGMRITTFPTILASPSTSFGGKSLLGGTQFSLEATVAKNSGGNFSIQSRIERTPEAEQDGGGQPAIRHESK